jgi:hypothetical protein
MFSTRPTPYMKIKDQLPSNNNLNTKPLKDLNGRIGSFG